MSPAGSTELGVGVVWWPPLDALCREQEGLVDVIEAEPEAFWVPASDRPGFRSFLPEALAHLPQPKLLHGVGAPLGGTCPPPEGHGAALAGDAAALEPRHVSEHLSFARFRSPGNTSAAAGFMLPPLPSADGVATAAANIRRHRERLGELPFAVETPVSYLPPLPGEWPDGRFVAAVAEAADCGILLDLHNVLCNARNGRESVSAFCDALPPERVWELHLAGGEVQGGFFVDAHSGLIEPELFEIAAALIPTLPQLRAIVFEIMPERVADVGLAAIGRQLAQLRELWGRRGSDRRPRAAGREAAWPATAPPFDPESWSALLGSAVTGLRSAEVYDRLIPWWWDSAAPALELYRLLIGENRASAVAAAAPRTTQLLLRQHGSAACRRLFAEFWRQSPQAYTAADEARGFLRFLLAGQAPLPGLPEAAAADIAGLTALAP
jgi:uncharacterized protein (UPF0276 family)